MKECVVQMPVSLGLEKNSPLKPVVDKYVRRAIETGEFGETGKTWEILNTNFPGLTSKWLADAIRDFESSIELPPQEALMDLKKFYGALVALAVGYALGFLALIGEIIYWKCVVQKNPLYDKFSNRIVKDLKIQKVYEYTAGK